MFPARKGQTWLPQGTQGGCSYAGHSHLPPLSEGGSVPKDVSSLAAWLIANKWLLKSTHAQLATEGTYGAPGTPQAQ